MKMTNKDYCVFILTHGRADKVHTEKTLRRQGYTGEIFIVIDDEDTQADKYKELFGDKVLTFCKKEVAKNIDEVGNFEDRRAVVYARNVCFKLAKDLGYEYFIEADDDYTSFTDRFDSQGNFGEWLMKSLDDKFDSLLKFYKRTNCVGLAMSQSGDFIGGQNGAFGKVRTLKRKAMNLIICSTSRPFQFKGRINEDVNAYVGLGNTGNLFFSVTQLCLHQKETQSSAGGMTELYQAYGTYVKSFYSVIIAPYCVKVTMMGMTHKHLHHKIKWDNAVPKILSEEIKKK